jgi:hypothetical protein
MQAFSAATVCNSADFWVMALCEVPKRLLCYLVCRGEVRRA